MHNRLDVLNYNVNQGASPVVLEEEKEEGFIVARASYAGHLF